MTVTPVERSLKPDLRAERARLQKYHAAAKEAELFLTSKYGGDWLGKVTDGVNGGAPSLALPPPPQLTQEQQDALLQEAQARFAETDADPDALNRAYDVLKGTVRTGLSALDAGVDFNRNIVTRQALEVNNFLKNPGVETLGAATGVLKPERWPSMIHNAAYNTTLWTQIETAINGGVEAGFGAQGTGSGFFVGLESPVMQEKNARAYEFAPMDNGDAASLGRLLSDSLGFDKSSDAYKAISGPIDALAILALDPLNLITGPASAGSKASKISTVLRDMGASADEIAWATRAVEKVGGKVASDDEVKNLVHEVMQARARLRMVQDNPDLLIRKRNDWNAERANQARRDADTAVSLRTEVDDYRTTAEATDEAIKRTNELTDEAVWWEIQAQRQAEKPRITDGTQKAIEGDLPEGAAVEKGDLPARGTIKSTLERLDNPEDLYAEARASRDSAASVQDQYLNDLFAREDALLERLRAAGVEVPHGADPEDYVHMLRSFAGLTNKGVNVRQAVNMMVNGDMDNVAKLVARLTDPADLYDLFPEWGTDTLRTLAHTADEHEAFVVILNGVIKGDITRATNKVALWTVGHGQSGAKGSSWARRVTRIARDGKPSSAMASFDDPDAMVKITNDFVTEGASMAYRKGASLNPWEGFRKQWIGDMINAPDAITRKRVWIQMQQEFLEQIPGWGQLNNATKNEWRSLLGQKLMHKEQQAPRWAFLRSQMRTEGKKSTIFGLADDPHTFDQQYEGLITSMVDLSDNLSMLSTKHVRKLFNLVDEAGRMSAKGRTVDAATLVNDAFDDYVRPLYLAFRPGYLLLQIMDSGMRALLTGHMNLLTSPLQTMTVAAHLTMRPDSRFLAALDKIVRTVPVNPDGTPMFGKAQVSALENTLGHMQDSQIADYLMRHQFRDVFVGHDKDVLLDLGWQSIDRGGEGFHRAWIDNLLVHLTQNDKYGDDMFQDVFTAMRRNQTPQRIQEWVDRSGLQHLSSEEAITEFYFAGPGQERFQQLIASAQTRYTAIPRLEEVVKDRRLLHTFLWDEDEAGSIRNLVDSLTGQQNPEIMQAFEEAAAGRAAYQHAMSTMSEHQVRNITKGKGKPFYVEVTVKGEKVRVDLAKRGMLERVLHRVVRDSDEDFKPLTVRNRAKAATGAGGEFKQFWDDMLGWFFTAAGSAEKRLGQAPLLHDDILLESAKRAALLSPDDAATLEQRILSQLPRAKRTPKQRKAISILKAGARNASGDGTYTLEDVTQAAQNAAMRKLSDTMYGIRGRNAAAARFAILFPFMQSWVNASRVYLKEAAKNPSRAANALRLLRTAQSSESGVIYDYMPGVNRDDDPAKPLFWVDDFGKRQVSIPFLGYATHLVDSALGHLIGGGQSNPNFQPYMNLRVSAWNPMNFGEPLPGVGPAITVPASVIDRNVVEVPSNLRKWIFAMDGTDSTLQKNLLEANLPWWAKFAFPSDEDVQAQVGNALAALVANDPQRYLDENGFVRFDALPSLTRDSEALAEGLMRGNLWRAAMFRGGTSVAKSIQAKDGTVVPMAMLSEEFNQIVDEQGSVGAGYAYLVDKYGPQGLAFLIGNRESIPIANDEGYAYAKDNPDMFDKTHDVLGYFFPSSDINGNPSLRRRSAQYQRLLTKSGENRMKSPEEWASDYNRVMKSVRDQQLEQKFIKGGITKTQYETEKALIGHEYQLSEQQGFNTSYFDQKRQEFATALTDPNLAQTPAGQALQRYFEVYAMVKSQADGESLDGETDAPLREYLRQTGEQLGQAVPEFIPAWRGVLMWEVDK